MNRSTLSLLTISVFLTATSLTQAQTSPNWLLGGNGVTADSKLGTNTGYSLLFYTNSAERMRLNKDGRLLLGMQSVPGTPPTTAKLYTYQVGGSDWFQFRRSADNGYWSFQNSSSQNTFILGWTSAAGANTQALVTNTAGNLGLGFTTATEGALQGKLNIYQGVGDWISLHRTLDAGYWHMRNGPLQDRLAFYFEDQLHTPMPEIGFINNSGKMEIGVSDPTKWVGDYRLYVGGGILTEKLKVALISSADWADYVFEPNYSLMPLDEVGEFIKSHGHLPGVPSADEMVDKGLDVAKTDAMLMAKIEELTLYVVQLKKELDEVKDK